MLTNALLEPSNARTLITFLYPLQSQHNSHLEIPVKRIPLVVGPDVFCDLARWRVMVLTDSALHHGCHAFVETQVATDGMLVADAGASILEGFAVCNLALLAIDPAGAVHVGVEPDVDARCGTAALQEEVIAQLCKELRVEFSVVGISGFAQHVCAAADLDGTVAHERALERDGRHLEIGRPIAAHRGRGIGVLAVK